MDIKITIIAVPAGLFTVKKWIIPEDGMSASEPGSGSFQEVPFYTPLGGFGAISQFQRLGSSEESALNQMQIEDDFTVSQKMGWLINEESPLPTSEYWRKDGDLVYGTMVNGGNVIQVETQNGKPVIYNFMANYRTDPAGMGKHNIEFYRVLGLKKSQLADAASKRITHITHPHLIHKCTVAYPTDSRFVDHTPKGYIYTPVWDSFDYPSNYGNRLYIAKAFVTNPT
jgi:hypothetical protein